MPLRHPVVPGHVAGAEAPLTPTQPLPAMPDSHHLHWNAEALWRQLSALLSDISVEVVAHTDSTNNQLLDRARRSGGRLSAPVTTPGQLDANVEAHEPPTPYGRRTRDTQAMLLVAEHQSAGRGRLGRAWQSTQGASLTFSLALPLAPAEWPGLSLAAGVALADALDPPGAAAPRIGLKWPNDLWLLDAPGVGRKLGGVLIETVAVGERRMCVVGVGLNVLPQPTSNTSDGFACLHEFDDGASAPRALHAVAAPLVRALLQFEADGFAPFAEAFARRDVLRGQTVHTTSPQLAEGVAEGVDAHGALRVRAGTEQVLVSGEVSVRPLDRRPGAA